MRGYEPETRSLAKYSTEYYINATLLDFYLLNSGRLPGHACPAKQPYSCFSQRRPRQALFHNHSAVEL